MKTLLAWLLNMRTNRQAIREHWAGYRPNPFRAETVLTWVRGWVILRLARGIPRGAILRDLSDKWRTEVRIGNW